MGVVWEAEDASGRRVALKFLKRTGPEDSLARRFLREARAARAVTHSSIVAVHDVVELEDGSPVMVMELLEGETLALRLARERTVPLPELARLLGHVCGAVECAHALGIVHRDLKPENIFLATSPQGTTAKVLDFGVAKLTALDGDAARTGATTDAGAIVGSLLYISPEQLLGEKDVDHRADIWSLGAILYEALSGTRPIAAKTVGDVYNVVLGDGIVPIVQRAPQLPPPILDLVTRMLSRDRARRPEHVREVQLVLSAYAGP
jgi:serine/threonine-protein kinase